MTEAEKNLESLDYIGQNITSYRVCVKQTMSTKSLYGKYQCADCPFYPGRYEC